MTKIDLRKPTREEMFFYIGIFLGTAVGAFISFFEQTKLETLPMVFGVLSVCLFGLLVFWIFGE